jgi:hypothetical protein
VHHLDRGVSRPGVATEVRRVVARDEPVALTGVEPRRGGSLGAVVISLVGVDEVATAQGRVVRVLLGEVLRHVLADRLPIGALVRGGGE